jgi:hypothetical protein
MELERRRVHRTRPGELSYIQFEPEGGGIVLNASEEGLAFQAAGAVRQPSPIRLSVSPNPKQRIELRGEIAWMDEAKKSGGLRLRELTADARDQIRRWLTQAIESGSGTPHEEFQPVRGVDEASAILSVARNKAADRFPPDAVFNDVVLNRAQAAPISAPQFWGIPTTALLPETPSREMQASFFWSRLLRGVATSFVILVFVLMPILFLQNFRSEIGNSLIRIGEKLKSKSDIQPDASASIPAQIPSPSPPDTSRDTSSVPTPSQATPAKETPNPPDLAAAAPTNQETADGTDPNIAERQHSRPHSAADTPSTKGRSALAQQLWSAVGAGDSSAEVALAQLYLTGEGVPRNCEQARVLLRAAAKNGNIEAQQQLRKLNRSGCR